MCSLPRRYTDLAEWYPLITGPEEYEEEAAFYTHTILSATVDPPQTILELGSGAGANAYHYKQHFQTVTLSDLSPQMLEISRQMNPDCEHVEGDMRTMRLNRQFDAVFVHDAVCYMVEPPDLQAVATTAFVHLGEGGVALFAPDQTLDTFTASVESGGRDRQDRSLRYIIWTSDEDPNDGRYLYECAYLLHERGVWPRCIHEAHECGLFSRQQWLEVLSRAGFAASYQSFNHSELPDRKLDVFVGVK